MTYRAICKARLERASVRWAKRWLRAYRRDIRRYESQLARGQPTTSIRQARKRATFFEDYDRLGARTGNGSSGAIGGAAPVQGFGEVGGVPWYFRARGEHWRLEVGVVEGPDGEPQGDAVFERAGVVGTEPFCASWIGVRHAWSLIASALAEFREAKRKGALAVKSNAGADARPQGGT